MVLNLAPAKIAGEIPGERVSDPEKQSDWPAIAYAADGSLYAVYVEWNDKDADRVAGAPPRSARRMGEAPSPSTTATGTTTRPPSSPAAAARSPSGPASRNGNFDLYRRRDLARSGKVSKPERLTTRALQRLQRARRGRRGRQRDRGLAILPRRQRRYLRAPPHRQEVGRRRRASPPATPTIGSRPSRSTAAASPGSPGIRITPATTMSSCARSTARSWATRSPSPPSPRRSFTLPWPWMATAASGWLGTKAASTGARIFPAPAPRPAAADCTFRASSGCACTRTAACRIRAADLSTILTGRMTRYAELPHLAFDGSRRFVDGVPPLDASRSRTRSIISMSPASAATPGRCPPGSP